MGNEKTEYSNAEDQQLSEDTQFLNAILDHTLIMIAYMDSQFNFIKVNRAYAKADNKETIFFPGKNHFTLYPNPENEQIFRKVVETGVPYITRAKPFEFEENPERSVTYWDWSLIPIKNISDLVEGLVLTVQNVTDRWEAEIKLKRSEKELRKLNNELEQRVEERTKKLKESEEKFRTMTEQSVTGISIIQDNQIKYINQRLLDIIGYTKEEVDRWDPGYFLNIFHPDFKKKAIDASTRNQSGKGKIPTHDEFKLLKKNGDIYWIEIYAHSINFNGKPAAMNISVDITERKLAVEKLIESEDFFRTIAEQSFIGIGILQDDELKYANMKLANMYGYNVEEIIGKTYSEFLNLTHPEDRAKLIRKVEKRDDEALDTITFYQFRAFKKTGELFWANIYSRLITYQGKSAGLVTMIDITDKRKAEQVVKNEMKRLKEIDQIKDELINRISHELKTPLISIYSTSDLILNFYSEMLDDNLRELIRIIYRGGERLKTLVDNLMDIYLIESHELELNSKLKNVISTIKKAISNTSSQMKKRKHTLQVDLPNELIIKIDEKRIQQVISNILSNSIKYTPPEGSIFIKLSENGVYADIKITDTGIGFTKEEKEKLFNKFGKIERFGKGLDVDIEGPGLGLYIANEIIKLHKGEILLHSEGRNRGSTFIIRLLSER